MKTIYVGRGLYVLSAFLMMLSSRGWSNAASTAPVYLTCHQAGSGGVLSRYLSIDYSTKTVVTSDINDTKPIVDAEGRTFESAQITDSKIVWQLATKRANGRAFAQHFTLSRLTGDLSYYDDGTRRGEAWTCQVAARPTPKF